MAASGQLGSQRLKSHNQDIMTSRQCSNNVMLGTKQSLCTQHFLATCLSTLKQFAFASNILPSDSQSTNQLVPEGLTLSNGTKPSCCHFFCIQLKKIRIILKQEQTFCLRIAQEPLSSSTTCTVSAANCSGDMYF